MGIKGIFGEIGEGERVALAKLAVEKLEKENRPLRIAIDISIWHFQIQAGKGGAQPALRTLYYRLVRLTLLNVQPIFVFDGPHKPKYKRGRNVGQGAGLANKDAKQVISFFGFPCHNAPGEAEAECALLQREGIVDAVLSEDVDTLMFGCGLTLKNWSSQNSRGTVATHVSMYDSEVTKKKSGLDRSGMVLVAMMSGGDYIEEGIPGCGVKTAIEAARANFGDQLCLIKRSDKAGLQAWKERLTHELHTNESKIFRTKHKALKIPDDFPDMEVLGFYTNPVVSTSEKINKLKRNITWDAEIDVIGLREYTGDVFEWTGIAGAKKFIRGIAPPMLVRKLLARGNRRASGLGDVMLTTLDEMDLVRSIERHRNDASIDGLTELRLAFVPNDIVGLDLEDELDEGTEGIEYGRSGLAINPDDDDDENALFDQQDQADLTASPRKRARAVYEPTATNLLWVPETFVKFGCPLKVEDYEESIREKEELKKKTAERKATAAAKKKGISSNMPRGALDKFVTATKPASRISKSNDPETEDCGERQSKAPPSSSQIPAIESSPEAATAPKRSNVKKAATKVTKAVAPASKATRSRAKKKVEIPAQPNPWAATTANSNPLLQVTRKPNDNIQAESLPTFKVPPGRDSFSPIPEPFSSRETSLPAKDAPAVPNASKPSRKRRNPPVTTPTETPKRQRKSSESNLANLEKETSTPSRSNSRRPSPSPRVNRRLDFASTASSQREAKAPQITIDITSSPVSDMDDVFSSQPKVGSSFNDALNSSFEVKPGPRVGATSSTFHGNREVINLDDSPPASPSPVRSRENTDFSVASNSNITLRRSPKKTYSRNRSSSPSKPITDLAPVPPPPPPNKAPEGKRFIVPRTSLEGSWKLVEEGEIRVRGGKGWDMADIEIVDLSGN